MNMNGPLEVLISFLKAFKDYEKLSNRFAISTAYNARSGKQFKHNLDMLADKYDIKRVVLYGEMCKLAHWRVNVNTVECHQAAILLAGLKLYQ